MLQTYQGYSGEGPLRALTKDDCSRLDLCQVALLLFYCYC